MAQLKIKFKVLGFKNKYIYVLEYLYYLNLYLGN